MLLRCAVIFTVIWTVQPASYYGRNIPVEVRYHDTGSNLSEKVQLSPSEVGENQLRLEKLQSDSLKNEKLSDIAHKLEEEKTKTDILAAEKASLENSKLQEAEETGHRIGALADQKIIEANKRHAEEVNKLTHLTENLHEQNQLSPEQTKQALKYIPVQESEVTTESKSTDKLSWLNQAQNYIEKGLEDLKTNFKPTNGGVVPKPEFWERLDNEVREYFKEQTNKLSLKQSPGGGSQQNFFQNLANGFQSVTNNFIQSFQGNSNTTGQEDDSSSQQQAPWQGFVGYFQGGVQNLVSTVQNFGQQTSGNGNSTVLGDSGSNNQQPPFFGGIISNVQQFFQGTQNTIQGVNNGTQGDTPSTGNQPTNIFQGAFNQVVGIFTPSSTPASAQGDEGSASTQAPGPFQPFIQQVGNIGTAFNQFIQGGNRPQGSEDDSSTSAPPSQNFIQSIGQNIGNAFQNIQNQFRPPTIPSVTGNDSSNPISGIAGQIQQVAGQTGSNNPLENLVPSSSNTGSSSKQPADQPKPSETEQSNEVKEKSDEKKPVESSREEPIKENIEEPKKESTEEKQTEEPIKELEVKPTEEGRIIGGLRTVVENVPAEVENAVVPEEQHVPVVKKVDNIEEIIENVAVQKEETPVVETKKIETMEATE